MSSLQERVAHLLAEQQLSQAEASRRGGFNNTAFINDILRGHKKSVRGPNLVKLAKALGTTESFLLEQTEDASARPAQMGRGPQGIPTPLAFFENFDAPSIDKGQFPRDVPIIGIAACGDDASFTLNGQTGDYVRRPPGLEGRRSVYALNVFGDSMYPVYRHNALVYVDPNKTPGISEDAVIELHAEDLRSGEPGKGFLKRVKKIASGKIICEQFNPPEEVIFERDEVKHFHRVIPWEEVLGY